MADGKVLVVMGSDSDFPVMEGCFKMLNKFGVGFKATVASAHRTPDKAMTLARNAEAEGYKVIIAAAGLAAHLGGVLAANTALPVIGVPCKGGALAGVDALYATVQMPTGIPVATVAIDGGSNAAILACQMLAISDPELMQKIKDYKAGLADLVEERDARLQQKIAEMG
ncbi:MAG: 5-(carboxyamino)imidazole ribonucleotide mutase [Saccharofermentans sp.]|nr:5-(carboxyamino)imidazole ribonucleotide mutase [Saccharofermentans sp.]